MSVLLVMTGLIIGVSCKKPIAIEEGAAEPAEALVQSLAPEAFVEPQAEVVNQPPPFVHDKSAQVSILCYHEFSGTGNATDMTIPTTVFREQMLRLKESGASVISMEDFLAWRRGEKNIPEESFVITMDDGWKSVYTDAFPIMKEFGFPFTIFLYTNYIASGSKSMTVEQIKEMLANGASLGCHSRSHPYPQAVKAAMAKGKEAAETFLRRELVESADKLEQLFGQRPRTYAYPGGFFLAEMFPFADEAKYEALFTVNPAKVGWETSAKELHRYVILGKSPASFIAATSFKGVPLGRKLLDAENKELKIPVTPADGERIKNRQPILTADLSAVSDIDPASIMLRVSGLGKVNATYDPVLKHVRYALPVRLRSETCSAYLYWKRIGEKEYDAPLVWKFQIDLFGSLLESVPPPPPGAKPPPPIIRNETIAPPALPAQKAS